MKITSFIARKLQFTKLEYEDKYDVPYNSKVEKTNRCGCQWIANQFLEILGDTT